VPGPADDQRNAVAAFPLVPLHAPPRACAVVVMVSAHGDHRGHLRPVVAGEHHQRPVGQAEFIEGFHQLADDPVQLEDEISVRPGAALALESVGRERREVDGLARMKQEKGPAGMLLHVLPEKLPALLEKDQVDLFQIESRGNHTRATVVRVRMPGQSRPLDLALGRNRDPVTVDVSIEPIGGRAAGGAEEPVESTVDRGVRNTAGIVDAPDGLAPVPADRPPLLVGERQADVPFAEAGRRIALIAEHLRQRQPAFLDHARTADSREHSPHPRAKRHPPRQQAVARRRADGRRAVRVGETHPFGGEPVQVDGRHPRFRIVAPDVAVAEIIRQNHEDVRPLGLRFRVRLEYLDPGGRRLGLSREGRVGPKKGRQGNQVGEGGSVGHRASPASGLGPGSRGDKIAALGCVGNRAARRIGSSSYPLLLRGAAELHTRRAVRRLCGASGRPLPFPPEKENPS